ncbi:MAG TPA: DUF1501 domain-containing protein [Thiothrix sp.]|nr:DUF1501 domain-containing protein [Thiothrix sp.]
MRMNRRDFLGLATILPVLPYLSLSNNAAAQTAQRGKTLILLELKGGNDGLNTLIPYQDDLYYHHRPNLAIRASNTIPLTQGMAMHPALKPLTKLWEQGDLAWVQGIGYPQSSESHFLACDVWHTARPTAKTMTGWLAHVLPQYQQQTKGISFDEDFAALQGRNSKALMIKNPQQFLDQVSLVRQKQVQTDKVALAHILAVQNQLGTTAGHLSQQLTAMPQLPVTFPQHLFGKQLAYIAQMIAANVDVPIYKLSLGSFDTHINQSHRHASLLLQLAEGLNAFQQIMQHLGRWNEVLIMSYSEFGRRVAENGNGGTDHGTASVQMIAGGQVRGGLYGQTPRLDQLDKGNLAYTTDFRSSYTTIAKYWLNSTQQPWGKYPSLSFLS